MLKNSLIAKAEGKKPFLRRRARWCDNIEIHGQRVI
jgi:hypothetical protein